MTYFMDSFIFDKYSLSTYFIPGMGLCSSNTMVNIFSTCWDLIV